MLNYSKDLKRVSQRETNKGPAVLRQKIIERYVVDFYCPKARLVIELDGGQHYEDSMIEKDVTRDVVLKGLGLKVLRFSDREVLTDAGKSPPAPLFQRGGQP